MEKYRITIKGVTWSYDHQTQKGAVYAPSVKMTRNESMQYLAARNFDEALELSTIASPLYDGEDPESKVVGAYLRDRHKAPYVGIDLDLLNARLAQAENKVDIYFSKDDQEHSDQLKAIFNAAGCAEVYDPFNDAFRFDYWIRYVVGDDRIYIYRDNGWEDLVSWCFYDPRIIQNLIKEKVSFDETEDLP